MKDRINNNTENSAEKTPEIINKDIKSEVKAGSESGDIPCTGITAGKPGFAQINPQAAKIRRSVVFVAVLTSLATTFMGSATNLSIPDISADFAVGASSIGWLVLAYTLPIAAFSVPMGRLADMAGRKLILVLGLIIFSMGCLISVLSPDFTVLIVSRVIQAVGAACIFATNHAILIAEYPPYERGKALGYALAATYAGLSSGPVIGGIINHYLGWRHIFTVALIIGAAAAAFAIAKVPARRTEEAVKIDVSGNILYILMLLMIIYGLAAFSTDRLMILLVPAGLIVGFFFVMHELKTDSPMVDVRLFVKNKAYTFSNLAALLNYAATYAITYLLSIYLQVIAGFSSQTAGLILIVQPAIMAVLTPGMGKISDRVSPYKLASLGMGFCAAALFILAFLQINTPLWVIILVLAFAGVGFGVFSSPNTNAVMGCVPKSSYGVASSVLSTMRNVGQNMGMVILTIVISNQVGNALLAEANPAKLVATMRISYIIFAVICVMGIFCSMARRKY